MVQQRSGAATVDNSGRAGDQLEQHADRVADLVVAGRSAEATLDEVTASGGSTTAGVVQCQGGLPEPPFGDDDLRATR